VKQKLGNQVRTWLLSWQAAPRLLLLHRSKSLSQSHISIATTWLDTLRVTQSHWTSVWPQMGVGFSNQ
jgi:hypothetical protein